MIETVCFCSAAMKTIASKASSGVPAHRSGQSPFLNSWATSRDLICNGLLLECFVSVHPIRVERSDLIHWDCVTFVNFLAYLEDRADTSILVPELGKLRTTATHGP